MKFTSKEDIDCPIDHVFAMVSDFVVLERQALRRGAQVHKTDKSGAPGLGSSWEIDFPFRQKSRHLTAVISKWEPPLGYVVTSKTAGLDGQMAIELVALSRGRTRLSVAIELQPRTLAARIMVQSLRLGRGTMQRKFDLRMSDFASEIVERYRPR